MEKKIIILIILLISALAVLLLFIYSFSSANALIYGNYCGLGGNGDPVDEFDKTCQIHDKCYEEKNISTGIVFAVKQMTGLNNNDNQMICDREFCSNLNELNATTLKQRLLKASAIKFFRC